MVRSSVPDFNAEKTLVIGVSLTSDIKGGLDAGLDVCWFNPSHKATPDNIDINYIIDDLSELYDIVK